MTTKIKHRILIVRCKTLGCDVDLDYKSAGSGIGALAPIEPTEPYHVFMKSIEPDPGTLTCPECQQAHDYSNDDIEEKAIPEMEIGDTVTAWGQNALFELLSVKDGTAYLKQISADFEIQVPYSVVTLFKKKGSTLREPKQ